MMGAYDRFIARCKAVVSHPRPPEPPMRLRLHEAGHAMVGYRFGYAQQGIMLREDDTGETSQQYATGMDDDMSVRLQTETIISMAGFAVTLEYPEYRTDALRIGGDVQMELVNAAIIHRIDPAMGSTGEIMDSLWVRARLAARNNRPPDSGGRRKARPLRFLDRRGYPANHRRMRKGAGPMSGLEWPADLTDFRLPPAWDGRPVGWHGWHPPIEARALFLCENKGLLRARNRVPDAGTRSSHGGRRD